MERGLACQGEVLAQDGGVSQRTVEEILHRVLVLGRRRYKSVMVRAVLRKSGLEAKRGFHSVRIRSFLVFAGCIMVGWKSA